MGLTPFCLLPATEHPPAPVTSCTWMFGYQGVWPLPELCRFPHGCWQPLGRSLSSAWLGSNFLSVCLGYGNILPMPLFLLLEECQLSAAALSHARSPFGQKQGHRVTVAAVLRWVCIRKWPWLYLRNLALTSTQSEPRQSGSLCLNCLHQH